MADSITSAVAQIAHANVDLIFWPAMLTILITSRRKLAQQNLSSRSMSGDAAYEFGGYTQGNYRDLYLPPYLS